MKKNNKDMYKWMKDLFPICRSLTGIGVDKTLNYIKDTIGINFSIIKFKSGSQVFDWKIPKVWNIRDAYIKDQNDKKIVDFKKNNLHIVGYSHRINKILNKKELLKNIFTQPNQPNLIPYVTSYYRKNWGFCISENQKKKLKNQNYKVFIDSNYTNGNLKIAEKVIKGRKKKEIFFSTYFCHPSMANDNLSSIIVQSALIKYIQKKYKKTNYTYRFVFLPETIGSIAYLSKNLSHLKKNMLAGFNLSCVGDGRCYSHIESREKNNLADNALQAAFIGKNKIKNYSYLFRGSDERQYCAPGIDLPVCGFSRSKYGEYPEYHTNADNLSLITEKSLQDSLNILTSIVDTFECGLFIKTKINCEPQLGKYNLYPMISQKGIKKSGKFSKQEFINRCNLIAYSDGKKNIFEIAKIIKMPLNNLIDEIKILRKKKII